jgi:uncharacterized protein
MTPSPDSKAADYVIGVVDDPAAIAASEWDALLSGQAHPTPFMRHAYLAALHRSGSAVPRSGWSPRFLVLRDRAGELAGACAVYAKTHSYGEYVFDWAWAQAYQRHGLRYFPKGLCAVPFTPVPGTRLLARDAAARAALVQGLRGLAEANGWSSAHVLFVDDTDAQAFTAAGWLMREGVQFHWQQDAATPAADFEGLLARLQRDKRKKIQQERRRVREQGVGFRVLEGAAITASDWDFFHHCYTLTYRAHQSTPYLTRAFFDEMAQHMPEHWLMFVAEREGRRVAVSLIAIDRARGTAWGRYWGCTEPLPCLHFEACYYQPLAWCLAQGFTRFEGGAQGEHKMARGLLPVRTASAHWLADARFAQAVAYFLAAEGQGMDGYIDELRERSPFKDTPAT